MRKKNIFFVVLAIALASLVLILSSCKDEPDVPPEEEYPKIHDTTDGDFEFDTLNSKLKVSFSNGGMTITSFASDEFEWVDEPFEYDFFGNLEDYTFTYNGATVTEEKDSKTVTAKFVSSGLEYTATVVSRKDYGIVEIGGNFKNITDKAINVRFPDSFKTAIKNTEGLTATAYRKESGAAEGLDKYRRTGTGSSIVELEAGKNLRTETKVFSDWNSNGYIPLIIVNDGRRGVLFGFESGECNLDVRAGETSVTLIANLSMGAFQTNIVDELEIPPVYLGVYEGNEDSGSNLFKRWYFDVKSPNKLKEDPAEPLIQGYLDANLNTLNKLSFQSANIDYGWWNEGDDKAYEGSWVLRNKNYSSMLNGSFSNFSKIRTTRAKNIENLTAYVLLHDTTLPGGQPTDEYGEFNSLTHPEWFSSRKINGVACADLGNVECVEYLKTALTDFFNTNDAHTWRSDFEPIASRSANENRHMANGTDVAYWNAVGFYDILDHLYKNVENFRYECCSAGGSLKDYATLRYATVINCEDTWNYLSCRMVFWDSSWCIPPAQIQLNTCVASFCSKSTSASENWGRLFYVHPDVDQKAEGFDRRMQEYGIRSALMGVPGYNAVGGAEKMKCDDLLKEYNELYQTKIKDLVKFGELYHILPRPDGENWDGVMYADPDTQNEVKGLILLFKPTDKQGSTIHITPEGLKADATYSLVFDDRPEQNVEIKGEELMKNGLDVTINEELGSEMIWIYEK